MGILFVLGLVWAIFGAGSWAVVAVGLAPGVIAPFAFQAIGNLIRHPAARWMH